MSDVDEKRNVVTGLYSSARWKKRVAGMSDRQVIAIYMSEQNKAKERPKPSKPKESGDDVPF